MPTIELRSDPYYHDPTYFQQQGRVDRKNALIRGVVAMQTGEARGHGIWADATTLQMARDLGNATGDKGIRQRLGHPGMSENATAKQIAVARDFQVDGDKLVHTMDFLAFARKSPAFTTDVVEYVMAIAETEPDYMGESVVMSATLNWVLVDGTERELTDDEMTQIYWNREVKEPPADAVRSMPSMRPVNFAFVDVVNEGALTPDGMFSMDVVNEFFEGKSSEFASQLFSLVDGWRLKYNLDLDDVQRKSGQIIQKYLDSRMHQDTINEVSDMRVSKGKKGSTNRKAVAMAAAKPGATVDSLLEDDAQPVADEPVASQPVADEPAPEPVADEPVADEAEPVAAQDDGEADDDLDAAEAILSQSEESDDDSQGEEIAELTAQVNALTAQVHELQTALAGVSSLIDDFTRMKALVRANIEKTVANESSLQSLDRNLRRIEGEPVVTQRVPASRQTALDPLFDYQHPVPSQALEMQPANPNGFDASLQANGAPPNSPRLAAVQRQLERQKRYKHQGAGRRS